MTLRRGHHNHKSPRRPNSLLKDEFHQDCRLLQLPAEIRNQIYGYALTKHDQRIELWPYAKINAHTASVVHDDPVLQHAAAELIARQASKKDQDKPVHPYFRDQQDLRYVRRHLSVALLATCRQIYHEAFAYFYRYNTFRFSDDINYIGVRRFLTTIGPRARQELRSLQLAYPDAFVSDATQFVHQEAEHYPDLHGFAKVYLDVFLDSWTRELEDNPEIAACNAAFIGNLLRTEMRDTLTELQFVITKDNWFRAEVEGDLTANVDSSILHDEIAVSFKDTPWLNKVIVVESGATFWCSELHQGLSFKTCDLLMGKGSRNRVDSDAMPSLDKRDTALWRAQPAVDWEEAAIGFEWEWTEEQLFPAGQRSSEEDISYGIQELLDNFELSLAACGGKARSGPAVVPYRYLKGFSTRAQAAG